MKRNRQNFFYFGPFFALLLPNNPENQNFENNRKMLEISSFDTGVPEIHDHMLYCSYDMASDGCGYFRWFFVL